MTETVESEQLLASLRLYLEDLCDSGIDELPYGRSAVAAPEIRTLGNPQARLVFVLTGGGFEGEGGELFGNIVKAMGFAREEVHLICLPEANAAVPSRTAVLAAIHAVEPEVVVALGETAAHLLLESQQPIAEMRGTFNALEGVVLMPTLHPDALLENPALKREVWEDMKQVMRRLVK